MTGDGSKVQCCKKQYCIATWNIKLWDLAMDRDVWHSAVHGVAKSQTRLSDWSELNSFKTPKWISLFAHIYITVPEKAMAPHSSILACQIPWTEEPGGLQSMGSRRVWHDSDFPFTFQFHTLEKEMATHSSVLAWRIPGTGEPGGLLSMGSHRVGHDWSDLAIAAYNCPNRF